MNKIKLMILAILLVAGISSVDAKGRFGLIGGANFSHSNYKEWNLENVTQYQFGITSQARLPLGFSVQPSLLYQAKGMSVDTPSQIVNALTDYNLKMGFLELPVAVQWGIDLLLFRPYLEVAPFVGCAVAKNDPNIKWTDINRFSYGVGLGGGLEVWKLQVSARYNWNLGPLAKASTAFGTIMQNKNFGGVTLSVAFFL